MAQAVMEGLAPGRVWVYTQQIVGSTYQERITITERQILAEYYPYWQDQMIRLGREDDIDPEKCIQDWVTVHWAWQLV